MNRDGISTAAIPKGLSVADFIANEAAGPVARTRAVPFATVARQLATVGEIASRLNATATGLTYPSAAALNANVAAPLNAKAEIRGSGSPAVDGVYRKSAAEGAAGWTRAGALEGPATDELAALAATVAAINLALGDKASGQALAALEAALEDKAGQQALTALSGVVATARAEIADKADRSALNAINAAVAAAQAALATVQNTLGDKADQDAVAGLSAAIVGLQDGLGDKADRQALAVLNGQVLSLQAEIGDKAELDALTALAGVVADVQSALGAKAERQALTALTNLVATTREDLDDKADQEALATVSTAVAAAQAALGAVQNALDDKADQDAVAGLSAAIAGLQDGLGDKADRQALAVLGGQVSGLQAELGDKAELDALTALAGVVASLQAALGDKADRPALTALSGVVTTARAEIADKADRSALTSINAALAAVQATLVDKAERQALTTLEGAVSGLVAANRAVHQVAAQVATRPGEAPWAYAATPAGGLAAAAIPASWVAQRSGGAAILLPGLSRIGSRWPFRADRVREVRFEVRRTDAVADVAGDAVLLGILAFNADMEAIGGPIPVRTLTELTPADGRQVFSALVSRSSGPPTSVILPANCVFAAPFVQTYGFAGVLVETLAHADATRVAALEARLLTLEMGG